MIPFGTIQTFFVNMATALSIPIILSDQDGDEPARPYVTYKIITENVENPRSNIRSLAANVTTPGAETTDIKYEEKSVPVISITIRGISQATMQGTRDVARSILHYLKTQTTLTILYSTSIEDRTSFIGGEYDYKIGFDFSVDYRDTYTAETVERMNTVEIEPTVQDELQPTFDVARDSEAIQIH